MNLLLFGKDGQLGRKLQHSLSPLGTVIALGRNSESLCGDLTDLEGIAKTVCATNPAIIVNAAAYTAVDKAESEPDIAHLINAEAPGNLAQTAKECDALLVQYSTDYVFNGSGDQPWSELAPPAPLNVYGKTKLDGERAIQSSGCRHLIFRTSWLYAEGGNNFIEKILQRAIAQSGLMVVDDQIGTPTGADLLAAMTTHALEMVLKGHKVEGLYNIAARGFVSRYELACYILKYALQAGIKLKTTADEVIPVPSSYFPSAAKRPLNSRLNCTKFEETFGLSLPGWEKGVSEMLNKILPQYSGQ